MNIRDAPKKNSEDGNSTFQGEAKMQLSVGCCFLLRCFGRFGKNNMDFQMFCMDIYVYIYTRFVDPFKVLD